MDRKAMARETLQILNQGYYEATAKKESGQGSKRRQIVIKEAMEHSIGHSTLISPADGEKILEKYHVCTACGKPETKVENISTVEAVRRLAGEGKTEIGVLNFAGQNSVCEGFSPHRARGELFIFGLAAGLEHSCIEKSLRWKRAGASDKMRKTKAAERFLRHIGRRGAAALRQDWI